MNRKTAPYGTFSDYPKIDIYDRTTGRYLCSTTWARTCREALWQYADTSAHKYRASFA